MFLRRVTQHRRRVSPTGHTIKPHTRTNLQLTSSAHGPPAGVLVETRRIRSSVWESELVGVARDLSIFRQTTLTA